MTDFALVIAAVLLVGVALIVIGWVALACDDRAEDHWLEDHPDTQEPPR